jgi:hypothetical protein
MSESPVRTVPVSGARLLAACKIGDAMALALNPGASEEVLQAVTKALGVALPHDYRAFLHASNGGEGLLGENYVALWKAEDLAPLNAGYEVARDAPGLLLFGSDGGGEAYAFDTRESPWVVVQVPFIGMGDVDSAIPRGSSFTEFLENVALSDTRTDGHP